jgi:hypothetical protein
VKTREAWSHSRERLLDGILGVGSVAENAATGGQQATALDLVQSGEIAERRLRLLRMLTAPVRLQLISLPDASRTASGACRL